MSYSRSIPNQILHYTASSAGYPSHAIRVGNFAISDAGNAPTGSYGEFLGGLNPYAFKTSEASRIADFENQTYTVYMQKNQCVGPACYLINDEKIVPNPGTDYPGGITPPQNPWYNLLKFTQYIVGSQSGSITSQIGYYGENTSNVLSNSIAPLRTTFQWYMDQRSTGDFNNYPGGTYGNRVVVNKFYAPLNFSGYKKLIDVSYTPCCIPVDDTTWYLKDLVGTYTSSISLYNYEWDFEGGYVWLEQNTLTGFTLSHHTGFGLDQTGSDGWTIHSYIYTGPFTHNDTGSFYFSWGDPTSTPFFGVGFEDSVQKRLFYINGGNTYYFATVNTGQWYWLTVTYKVSTSDLRFWLNGKQVAQYGSLVGTFTNVPCNLLRTATARIGLQFFAFELGEPNPNGLYIRETFLRYALNTKIKISSDYSLYLLDGIKVKLALDTGTKASHKGTSQWLDISGSDLHGVTASFAWVDHKPGYTATNFGITHSSALDNMFVNPYTLSLWVDFTQTNSDVNIFKKGRNEIKMQNGGQILVTFGDGTNNRTYSSSALTSNKWYNIILTGKNPNQANLYIFSHTGSDQDALPIITTSGSINVTVDDISNILVGDSNGKARIASVIYFSDVFSQALANDFFAIQKGRFGYDSNENRIADLGDCLNE